MSLRHKKTLNSQPNLGDNMQKQITQFKVLIGEVESYFHFEPNCPTATAKEALFECLKWIGGIEDAAKAAQEVAEEAKTVVQEVKEALPTTDEVQQVVPEE